MTTGTHPSRSARPAPGLPGPGGWPAPDDDRRRPGTPAAPARPAGPAPRAAGVVSRVSVLAPHTRIDVALPADVPLADLVPALLDMAGEPPGPEGAGWTLALLGRASADPERTLAEVGVLDGDQLVLRRRPDAAPPPLYDDVADAVAEAVPASYRAWGPDTAHRLGLAGLGAALAVAVLALAAAGRGPGTAAGVGTAVVAGLAAALCVTAGAVVVRVTARPAAGAVLAVGGVGLAGVCGVAAVPATGTGTALPATWGTPHLLLASVLVAVTAAVALAAVGAASRSGLAALVALAAAGAVGALAGTAATVADALAPPGGGPDAAAVAAGVGALALVALSGLPRTGIALARLPLPQVPASAEELAEDPGVAEHAEVELRTDRAHAAMSGLVLGAGSVVAVAVAVLAAAPAPGLRGAAGGVLAALLVVLLALRSRTYANAVQATVLLVCALTAAVAALGGVVAAVRGAALYGLAAGALVGGAVALVLGVVVAGRRFSPVTRRAVDLAEAVGIAAVLPLALGVMDLYTAMRLW